MPASVLVTQPSSHAQPLLSLLSKGGFSCLPLPVISIHFLACSAPAETPDFIVATSPNAVKGAIKAGIHLPQGIPCFSTGMGTTKQLSELGISGIHTATPAGTEGLLAIPAFEAMAPSTGWLLSGIGGRGLIDTELSQRGHRYQRLETYERRSAITSRQVQQTLSTGTPDFVTLSSREALDNLLEIADAENLAQLASSTWIVSSERIALAVSEQWANTNVLLADGPDSESLYKACVAGVNEH